MEPEMERGAVVIAMKGLPYSGKSIIARRLSRNFRWPVIDQDDVQSSIVDKLELSSFSDEDIHHLDDISFDAVCEMARTFLAVSPQKVIIDSSLSHRSRLDQLLQLRDSTQACLIMVECVAKDKYDWRSWIEQRTPQISTTCAYKPSGWDDVVDLLQESDGSWDYDVGDVSKVVVDTTLDFQDFDLFFAVEELLNSQSEGVRHIDLIEWLNNKMQSTRLEEEEEQEQKQATRPKPQRHTHYLSLSKGSNNRGADDKLHCEKCGESIIGSMYACNTCDLSLHVACAESPASVEILPQDPSPYLPGSESEYSFPDPGRCNFCTEENKEFSLDCPGCLFQSHIKCALLPSVLHHEGHSHPLYLRIHPRFTGLAFKCHACGDWGSMDIGYACNTCVFKCHVKCALVPSTMKNKYHRHELVRAYSFECDDLEEHYCNACEELRNPNGWMYYCEHEECEFACHLICETFAE